MNMESYHNPAASNESNSNSAELNFGTNSFETLLNSLDIFCFVNSKDIRDHLRKINYKFSSLEAAWIIYQCSSASLISAVTL